VLVRTNSHARIVSIGRAPVTLCPMPGPDKNLAQKSQHAMPGFVRKALDKRKLLDAYRARPAYQQNAYLGWIADAKLQAAMDKRVDQMLDELDKGNLFKGEPYTPPPPPAKKA
jgi:uncharacterized protein YdeI (YjbR/CyaY-like superfamily)